MRHLIKYVAAVTLLLTAALPIQAQDENAAFYIYQNDGNFNGFFYDQVQKISYSKLDTLGVEHEDFVSQEIITADSTYRFMLSAIDSVGFVQPEIIFNPRLRDMREDGLRGAIKSIEEDGLLITFQPWLPEEKRPKVGDVLMDWDFENGFCVKVVDVMVSNITRETIIDCEPIEDIRDVFQQFITVEEYGKNDQGDLVRRRVAGMPEMCYGDFSRKRSSGDIDLNLLNFSLTGHIPFLDEENCKVYLDPTITAKLNVKADWNIPLIGSWYFNLTLKLNADVSCAFTIDGTIKDKLLGGLNSLGQLPLPAAAPIFMIDFGPDGFIKSELHAKFMYQTPKYGGALWARLSFRDHWLPNFDMGFGTPSGEKEEEQDPPQPVYNPNATMEFSGFLHGGLSFPLKLKTNKWLSAIIKSEIGVEFLVGPKITGTVALDLNNLAENGSLDIYGNIKDTRLTVSYLSAEYEAAAVMKTFFSGEKTTTLAEGSINLLGDLDVYLFPEFKLEATVEPLNATHGLVKAKLTPSRVLVLPVRVGVYLGQIVNSDYGYRATHMAYEDDKNNPMPNYYVPSKWLSKKSWTCEFEAPPGEYELRPVFEFMSREIKASPVIKVTVPGAYLELDGPDSLFVKGIEHTDNVKIKTNCKFMTTEVLKVDYANSDTSWIHPVATDSVLIIKCDRNPNLLRRKAKVALSGLFMVNSDSIKITKVVYVEQGSDVKYVGAQINVAYDSHYPDKFLPCTTKIVNDTLAYITVDADRYYSCREILKYDMDSVRHDVNPAYAGYRVGYWDLWDLQETQNYHYKSEIVLNLNTQSIVRVVNHTSINYNWLAKYYTDENYKSGKFRHLCDYQATEDYNSSFEVLPTYPNMYYIERKTEKWGDNKQYQYDTFRDTGFDFDSGKIKSYSATATVTSNQGYGGVYTFNPPETLYVNIKLLTDIGNYQNALAEETHEAFYDGSDGPGMDPSSYGLRPGNPREWRNKYNYWK